MANIELTPMVKQFYDLKKKHPDAVLLFRCGDFYETYCDDAKVASEILGITLTCSTKSKDKDDNALRMAGFPYHALDNYLPRLIRAGKRVAICDQIEAPKPTKKKSITELVKPAPQTFYQIQITHRSVNGADDELLPRKFKSLEEAQEMMIIEEGHKIKSLLELGYPFGCSWADEGKRIYEITYLAQGTKYNVTFQVIETNE